MSGGDPALSLFDEVVGQEHAVASLRAAAVRPVHAFLFLGAAGNGGLAAAHAFAAALLCPSGGCGDCLVCRQARQGSHPDLHVVHRSGASLSVDDMRRLVTLAQRRPLQADRQVIILTDVHLGGRAAPALLKTLEEPPGDTVFILLADDLTPELATIASRCVQIDFPPVPRSILVEWLLERGSAPDLTAVIADTAGGNPERARVMLEDPDVSERAALWSSVPERLNGSGDVVAGLVRQLLESADSAVAPLKAEHARELERLTEESKEMGERALPGRKELIDHQNREERRWRADAVRAGLGAMARAYGAILRGQLHDTGAVVERRVRAATEAVGLITEATRILPRNPNDTLLLQALLVRLGALEA